MDRTFLYIIVTIILLLSAPSAVAVARQYDIDSQGRFDELREATFQPGDIIRLKRGVEFTGMFAPVGSGIEGSPIRITTYGEGARPRIDADGKQIAGLLLRNPSYWEVAGLEITNSDGSGDDQGELFGIYALATETERTYRHIYIDDCYVHDVNGKVAGKRRGGIHVHIKDLEASTFDDLRITHNRVERIGGVGIGNNSSCGRIEFRENDTVDHYLWTRVYVADNVVDTTGRNNIIARVSKDAIYERNTLARSSRYDTGHSIFCFNTDGIRIQHNEAYGNTGEGTDRGGFDADYNCVGTLIQYNYSHDNEWFCGIMKRRNRAVVIRYNISQNERSGLYFYGFESRRELRDVHIYNNTHFVRAGLDVEVFPEGRTPLNTRFENNIFYFEEEGTWGERAEGIGTTFHNNLYYGITPHSSETKAIVANPRLVDPGKAGTAIDLRTMQSLQGYRPAPGSPCIDAAVDIKNNGGVDFFGTKITKENADLGAVEHGGGK